MTSLFLQKGFDGFGVRREELNLAVQPGGIVHCECEYVSTAMLLYRCIAGVNLSDAKTIVFNGVDVSRKTALERLQIGLVCSTARRKVFPSLTAREHLRLRLRGRQGKMSESIIVDKFLSMFPLLTDRVDSPCGVLSGGQQQMVMLGTALLCSPIVLVIEEPFMGLAGEVRHNVAAVLKESVRQGLALLVIEQTSSPELVPISDQLRL